MNIETENIEFKSQFTEDIYKEVIAFANTDGGIVYVGIDNNGNAVGLTDVDQEYTRITNGIRDAIMPDVTMFVRFTIQENKVVRITVSEGSNKPYYLKGKGLKPSGVYVRPGTSSVPASPEQIRQMIKESDGDTFEEMRSMEQELTFEAAQRAFKLYGVEWGAEKYRSLGITQKKDGIYTNLALLLSDQCAHTTKIAVFSDDARTVFRDSKEFTGSIFKQFEDAVNYLALCNKTSSVIKGVIRTDKQDYPEEAIREALLNAIVHRDYSFSGRIFNLYADCPEQPQIEVTPNTFKIVLPNMNAVAAAAPKQASPVTAQMQKVLDYISEHGHITDEEVQSLLEIKKTRAFELMKQMRNAGLVQMVGRGAGKKYLAM